MSSANDEVFGPSDIDQRSALLQVLVLNAGLAEVLTVGGLLADSSALLANALDNISDSMAHCVSYLAVSRTQRWKASQRRSQTACSSSSPQG